MFSGRRAGSASERYRITGDKMSSIIRNFVVTFCVALLIFGLISYAVVTNVSRVFMPAETGEPSGGDTADTSGGGDTSGEAVETDQYGNPVTGGNPSDTETPAEDDSFTVLLVGTDYQPAALNDYDLTAVNKDIKGFPIKPRQISADSIMLLHIDRPGKRFVFSALPSDMLVQADGNNIRLCELFALKGISFITAKITAVTGMPIDYYAVVSVEGLASVVDSFGGITYTVPTDMNYDDPSQNLSIHIPKGGRTLSGKEAVDMLRYRGYTDGEVSRRALATSFLKSFINKITAPANLAQASSLYRTASQYIETNFLLSDLTAHLDLIFQYPYFTSVEVTYPGTASQEGGVLYFEPDIGAAIDLYFEYR